MFSKKLIVMDLKDKAISSLQPNVSPRRHNLKFQGNETNFENCLAQYYFKTHISIRFNIRTFDHPYFFCICCVALRGNF